MVPSSRRLTSMRATLRPSDPALLMNAAVHVGRDQIVLVPADHQVDLRELLDECAIRLVREMRDGDDGAGAFALERGQVTAPRRRSD